MSITAKQKQIIITQLMPLSPKYIGLFGSRAKGNASSKSDFDIIVDFDTNVGFEYYQVADKISKELGANVDLVTPRSVSKHIYTDIKNDINYIYGKKSV